MPSPRSYAVVRLLAAALLATVAVEGKGQAPPAAGTATALNISPNPSQQGQAVRLTARVALVTPGPNAPTGTVEFFDLETSLGTATLAASSSGRAAVLELTTLGAGPHSISARYLGDTQCAGSRSPMVAHEVMGQNVEGER
jgi:hypothetical protein